MSDSPTQVIVGLETAFDRRQYDIAGHHLYCLNAPRSRDYAMIRFNDPASPRWVLQQGLGFNLPFEKFWLDVPGGGGPDSFMVLMVGADAPETHLPIDNRTAASDIIQDQLLLLQSIDSKL